MNLPALILLTFMPFHHAPAVPVPPPAPVVVATPAQPAPTVAPIRRSAEATPTTTTTEPGAVPGPQPYSPGTSTTETSCVVTWTETDVNPVTGISDTEPRYFGGSCSDAEQVLAEHPGATMTTQQDPVTYG